MIVLVTGGRDFTDRVLAWSALSEFHAHQPIMMLIHGAAKGADSMGHAWALANGVQPIAMEACWDHYNNTLSARKGAKNPGGAIRNRNMLVVLRALKSAGLRVGVVAFPGGAGTANMVKQARDAGIEVLEISPEA